MGDRCPGTTGEYSREHAAPLPHPSMADGKRAAVDGVQSPGPDFALYRSRAYSQVQKLCARNHPVLGLSEPG
jgi:hypothetical protein